jgi:hypothetical protein
VQGASEYILLVDTVGSLGKLKVTHSVFTRHSESLSVTPSTVTEASFRSALFCVFVARVRHEFSFMIVMW